MATIQFHIDENSFKIAQEAAAEMGVTLAALARDIFREGVGLPCEAKELSPQRPFEAWEESFIVAHAKKLSSGEIANLLDRSQSTIINKMVELGVKKRKSRKSSRILK